MSKLRKLAFITVMMFTFNIILPSISISATVIEDISDKNEVTSNEVIKEDEVEQEVTAKQSTYSSNMLSNLENPINGHQLTEDFFVKGWAISMSGISKVDVYLDGNHSGQAEYGIARSDIAKKYPEYPNAGNSGFTFKFRNVSNGSHVVMVRIYDTNGQVMEHSSNIVVSNNKNSIMGKGTLTKEQMVKHLRSNNPNKSYSYLEEFIGYTITEAAIEGINHDVLYSQMMNETGYLKFGGDVKEEQNNFAGIGATGNGVPGNSFDSIQIGIRAVVQHLKAYASTEPLKQENVDPRFHYVERGSATYVEHLGIKENPNGKGWAASQHYGLKLLAVRDSARKVSTTRNYSTINDVLLKGELREGNELDFSATANPSNESLYKLWVCDRSTNTWTVLSDWSTKSSVKFTPNKAGKYTFTAHVKHKSNTGNVEDDFKSVDVNIAVGKSKVTGLTVDGNKMVNSKLTMKATAQPAADTLYKLWVCDRSTNTWTVLSDWSTKSTVEYTPKKAGNYTFTVHAKHKNSVSVEEDDFKSMDVQISPLESKVKSLEVTGNKFVNSKLTMKATAEPAADTLYKLWVCDRSTNTWTVLSDWSTKNTIEYTPKKVGNYTFTVHAKHKSSNNVEEDDYRSMDVQISPLESKVTSLEVTGSKFANSKLTMKATAEPAADTLYKLWVCDRSTNTWTVLSDWSTKNTIEYTPKKAGNYTFTVHAKHKNSINVEEDDYRSMDVKISPLESKVNSLDVSGEKLVNSKLTMKATAEPAADTLYKLWVCDRSTNTWTVLSDWSTKSTVDYTPKKAGKYTFTVHVKHKSSISTLEDDFRSIDLQIGESKSKVDSLTIVGDKFVDSTLTMNALGSPAADTLYKLWVCDRSTNTWTVLSDWSTTNSVKYVAKKAGKYTFTVHVKHKNSGNSIEDDYKSVDVEIAKNESKVTGLNVTGSKLIGSKVTMQATAEPAADTLYKLWVCDRNTNKWTVLSDWSTTNVAEFTPKDVGRYTFTVHVKHKKSINVEEDDFKSEDVYILEENKSLGVSLDVTGSFKSNEEISIKTTGLPTEDTLYRIWIGDRQTGEWTILSDYSSKNSIKHTIKKAGKYSITVHFKHKNSTSIEEDTYLSEEIIIKDNKLVVIDPGHNHGGDGGSTATHSGIRYLETDLNMQVAVKLRQELERRGYTVVMTRYELDRFYDAVTESLRKRVDLANSLDADLFISIHQNAVDDSSVKGVEVYYSTATPGTRGIVKNDGQQLSSEPFYLGSNERNASKVTKSKTLATDIVNELSSKLGYVNRKAKDSRFYVVKNTMMPSVLVECGFITNASEAKKLADPNMQAQTAKIIADAVDKNF
ncbi:MAG: N-acetylmuramoyl-L-alanine amidase [Clostridium sp.]